MGLLEFSWATITLIDIGVLSISVIGLWWLKNQVDRYKALSEELEKRYNTLQQEHTTLQQAHETIQQEHTTLQQAHETIQQEHTTLQQAHETIQQEHTTLQQAHETIQQEHITLKQEFRTFQSTADRRYNALQHESETQYNTLHEEWKARYEALEEKSKAQYITLQEAWENRHNTLQEKHDALMEETAILRTGLETVTQEHKILERKYDTMAGRYQEISDKFTLILEKLADRN